MDGDKYYYHVHAFTVVNSEQHHFDGIFSRKGPLYKIKHYKTLKEDLAEGGFDIKIEDPTTIIVTSITFLPHKTL